MFPDQQWGKTESTINDAVQWESPQHHDWMNQQILLHPQPSETNLSP